MAVYPAGNPGAYPLDPLTDVGEFRLLYGDTISEAYDPVEPGKQNYEELSDSEIQAFLSQGAGSASRGVAYLYLAMAGQAAKESRSVKDYDLSVDLTKRAADLRAVAEMWFGRADEDDLVTAEDAFEIVPTGRRCGTAVPEASPGVWGRVYVPGRLC